MVELVADLADKWVAPGQAKPASALPVDLGQRQACIGYIAIDLVVVAKDILAPKS